MTRVLLLRHAAHVAGADVLVGRAPGVGLSDLGRSQAQRLGERLSSHELAAVYTSPLERTVETATAVAAPHRLEPVVDSAFMEVDVGAWTGRRLRDLETADGWREWNDRRSTARAPCGEAMADVRSRVMAGLGRLVDRHRSEAVAVVTHAEIIRAVVFEALGCSLDRFLHVDVSPASITIADLTCPADAVIRCMNDTAHLTS